MVVRDWYKVAENMVISKLLSGKELQYELILILKNYISDIKSNNNSKHEGSSLGIHQTTFRPYIDKLENLKDCNIYDIKEYIKFDIIN